MKELALAIVAWIVLAGLLTYCRETGAVEQKDETAVWFTTGMWSRHNNDHATDEWNPMGQTHAKYRDNNTGLGLEYDYNESESVIVGEYRNSLNKHTNYGVYAWRPVQTGCWKAGGMAGMATGYADRFPATPIGGFLISCDGEETGFNITWLPTVVVAIQLKMRIK